MKIPFDSLVLAAVVKDLDPWIGSKVQTILQADPHSIVIELYGSGKGWLLLSWDAQLMRMHFLSQKPSRKNEAGGFCLDLRRYLTSSRLTRVTQRGFDRIVDLEFETPEGTCKLVAELMGKHTNLIFVKADGKMTTAAKWVGLTKSKRPILPGKPYEPPPFGQQKPLYWASPDDTLEKSEGASPFLLKLLGAIGQGKVGRSEIDWLRRTLEQSTFQPVLSSENGAYPVSVAPLGLKEERVSSISRALEAHYDQLSEQIQLEQARQSLGNQLNRVLLAREVALNDLYQAADTAARARSLQQQAELILAYQHQIEPGQKQLSVVDHEGHEVSISLLPDQSALENATRLFNKAKKAKAGRAIVREQILRFEKEKEDLLGALSQVKSAQSLEALLAQREFAESRRWLHHQPQPAHSEEEKPFGGHKVREYLAPRGWRVLVGENAQANDYLAVRLAKPNDWWLHVRGSASAHVVIPTSGHPEKVPHEVILFAAKLAVQHSPSKHASYVPVDYTLKKFVRRPKGASPGAVLYSREKTLYI